MTALAGDGFGRGPGEEIAPAPGPGPQEAKASAMLSAGSPRGCRVRAAMTPRSTSQSSRRGGPRFTARPRRNLRQPSGRRHVGAAQWPARPRSCFHPDHGVRRPPPAACRCRERRAHVRSRASCVIMTTGTAGAPRAPSGARRERDIVPPQDARHLGRGRPGGQAIHAQVVSRGECRPWTERRGFRPTTEIDVERPGSVGHPPLRFERVGRHRDAVGAGRRRAVRTSGCPRCRRSEHGVEDAEPPRIGRPAGIIVGCTRASSRRPMPWRREELDAVSPISVAVDHVCWSPR